MEIICCSIVLLAIKRHIHSLRTNKQLTILLVFIEYIRLFQLVVPFASPVSFRALFSPKPFYPNYELNTKDVRKIWKEKKPIRMFYFENVSVKTL